MTPERGAELPPDQFSATQERQVEVPSQAERYFRQLAGEEKTPRVQIPLQAEPLHQFGFDFFDNSQGFQADQGWSCRTGLCAWAG